MNGSVAAVEVLYQAVVTDPARWNEQMFAEWADAVASDGAVSRQEAKYVRRALRVAQTLHAFWLEIEDRPDLGWESRVDLALGLKAWRPVLALAEIQLATSPSEGSFEDVAKLFPLVNNQEFLDGIDYDAWQQTQT